jgi:hypothetical protein
VKNRPGKFNKKITVTSNASTPILKIQISGNVIPIPGIFRYEVGDFKVKSQNVTFRKMQNNTVKTVKRETRNDGDKPITVSFENVPSYITLNAVPDTLLPGTKGNIVAVYDANKNAKLRFNNDIVIMVVDDGETKQRGKLKVSATILATKPKLKGKK